MLTPSILTRRSNR